VATAQPYRIIGYADYDAGQPTAGSWTVSPSRIILMTPNSPLPGAVLQDLWTGVITQFSFTTTAYGNTNIMGSITLMFLMNIIRAQASFGLGISSPPSGSPPWQAKLRLLRTLGTTALVGETTAANCTYVSQSANDHVSFDANDMVPAGGTLQYVVQASVIGGATGWIPYNNGEYASLRLSEMMG
jgi:hypothetical protein